MSKETDRTVYRRDDGKWANKKNDSDRASSMTPRSKRRTQPERCCEETVEGNSPQKGWMEKSGAKIRFRQPRIRIRPRTRSIDPRPFWSATPRVTKRLSDVHTIAAMFKVGPRH
jgi:hypothetical protein